MQHFGNPRLQLGHAGITFFSRANHGCEPLPFCTIVGIKNDSLHDPHRAYTHSMETIQQRCFILVSKKKKHIC